MDGSENWLLIAATLLVKNAAKMSVRLVAGDGGGGFSRGLKVGRVSGYL